MYTANAMSHTMRVILDSAFAFRIKKIAASILLLGERNINMVTVLVGIAGFTMMLGSDSSKVQYAGAFLGAGGIYPTIPNTLAWAVNNTEGSLKRAVVVGMIVGWGNLNGIVSSNIYLVRESPRFWTGHGVVIGFQAAFVLGGSAFMHLAFRRMNASRAAGKMDAKWASMSDEARMLAGDFYAGLERI
jgi:hypothetical protein